MGLGSLDRTVTVLNFKQAQRVNKQARKVFLAGDTDGNGTLDFAELKVVLRKLGLDKECETDADFELIAADELRKADVDGSGTLCFDEFKVYFNALKDRLLLDDVSNSSISESVGDLNSS